MKLYPDFLVYDDGCHLLKFATNPMRSGLTTTTQKIAQMTIVVDKMHFRGHVDPWCKAHCNPNDFSELDKVIHTTCKLLCTMYNDVG
jgi:hypothetical protein